MVDAWFWLWVCEGFQVVLASNRWSMGRSIKSVWSTLLRAFFGEKRFVKGRGGAGGDGRGEGWYLIFIQKKKKIIHHIISYPVKYTLFMANVLNLIIFSPSFMLIRLSGVDRRFFLAGGVTLKLCCSQRPPTWWCGVNETAGSRRGRIRKWEYWALCSVSLSCGAQAELYQYCNQELYRVPKKLFLVKIKNAKGTAYSRY